MRIKNLKINKPFFYMDGFFKFVTNNATTRHQANID